MEFQTASALWWLLPLAGIIVFLYLLRMRRRDVHVPAVFLWSKLTADVRANAPFQKLRLSWLLVLQLLILTLLVAALANPLHKVRGLYGKATVIVLDASASMGATDAAPSRFEQAKRGIETITEGMGAADRLALIEAGSSTQVVFPLSGDKTRMRAAVRQLRVTDAPNNMGEALRLASAVVGQRPGARIIVMTDGAFPPVTDFSAGHAQIIYQPIGTTGSNAAVTTLEAADTPDGNRQIYTGIRNYGSEAKRAAVTFVVDGEKVDSRTVDLPAGQTVGQTLSVPPAAKTAQVTVTMPGDALKADDQATIYLQGAGEIHALLISPGNLFLERALSLEPNVRLDRATEVPGYERAGAAGDSRYDLVIFDGVPPQAVKAPAVWSFAGISPSFNVPDTGVSQSPRVVTWMRDHPLLRHVSLSSLLIEKSRKVRAVSAGQILVQGSDGPLMVVSERGGHKFLYVGWNLLDSDFPLQVSFPIFVDNAVNWLAGEGAHGGNGGLNIHTGQHFTVSSPDTAHLKLTLPDGSMEDLDASSGSTVVRDTDTVGRYQIAGSKTRTDVAVSLLNEAESDIRPHLMLDLSGKPVAGRSSTFSLADLWKPIVLIALLALGIEWWVFVRKS